jgi:MoxR-like ATPase
LVRRGVDRLVVSDIQRISEVIQKEMAKAVVGQTEVINLILVALMARGHVLMEGVPGTAKTLMVKALARTLDCDFKRIQFTPDLMPSDIIGTNIFNLKDGSFELRKGSIFTDLLLADEVNRTPPKTQAALLEAMEERQATIDNQTYDLPPMFMVFATQNPVEYEGTYPLPEAQLDRFMLKIVIDYPSQLEENEILTKYHHGFDAHALEDAGIGRVANYDIICQCRQAVRDVVVDESIISYISEITRQTRRMPHFLLGGSPRASIALLLCSKAIAAVQGRGYITPDDVKSLTLPVLRHRVILKAESEIEGITADDVLRNILDGVEVPR